MMAAQKKKKKKKKKRNFGGLETNQRHEIES